MTPYENLANAIIIQAAKDYRHALRVLRYYPKDRDALHDKREIERFFRSGLYGNITNVDGELLIAKLKEQVYGKAVAV